MPDRPVMCEEDVRKLLEGMEERLSKKMKESVPPSGKALRGWTSAGVILAVLTAITAPVLTVTWYASNKMNQLEDVQRDVDRVRAEVNGLHTGLGSDISELRKDVRLLREAFAAYTRTVLPMIRPQADDGNGQPFRLLPGPQAQMP